MIKLAFLAALAVLLTLRLFKKPEELAIYALILSSTLPTITKGFWLAWGERGFAFRLEYFVFILAVFLAYYVKPYRFRKYNSNLTAPFLCMFFLHLFTYPISMYWGTNFGVSSIKLIETFLYFFIIKNLTKREHLPKLLNLFVFVGLAVSCILLTISLTGSTNLYELFITRGLPPESTRFYKQFYLGIGIPRIWIAGGTDSYLPVAGILAFSLCLLKREWQWLYGTAAVIMFVRILSSGQRSLSIMMLVGCLVTIGIISKYTGKRVQLSKIFYSTIVLLTVFVLMVLFIPELRERFDFLMMRWSYTEDELLYEDGTFSGAAIVWNKLNIHGIVAWLFGFGGFVSGEIGSSNHDINTPLMAVYKFGIIGLTLCFFLFYKVAQSVFYVLKHISLTAEELSIVIGVAVCLINFAGASFLRGFPLVENFHVLGTFIILTAWMEVVIRNSIAKQGATKTGYS